MPEACLWEKILLLLLYFLAALGIWVKRKVNILTKRECQRQRQRYTKDCYVILRPLFRRKRSRQFPTAWIWYSKPLRGVISRSLEAWVGLWLQICFNPSRSLCVKCKWWGIIISCILLYRITFLLAEQNKNKCFLSLWKILVWGQNCTEGAFPLSQLTSF